MIQQPLNGVGPYTFQGTIGEGAFSTVRLCKKNTDESYCACKIIEKARLVNLRQQNRFEEEVRINQQLHHPGVVQILDLYADEKRYYMFTDFCPNGDLFEYIVSRKRLKEPDTKRIFRQILETIKYVHLMGVSHRDLKPENILVTNTGSIKISDFGLSKFVDPRGLVNTPCGSPCYASPECLSGGSYNGRSTDMWSCGVILFAMVTGQLPWTKRNQTQLFKQIKKGEYTVPDFVSPGCCNMIKKLMTVDFRQRYTVDQALADPWIADTSSQFETGPVNGYVSLAQVDKYFNREVPFVRPTESELGPRSLSCSSFDTLRITKFINSPESEPPKPKKPKKKKLRLRMFFFRKKRHDEPKKSEKEETKKREKENEMLKELQLAAVPRISPPGSPRPKSRPPSASILESSFTTCELEFGKFVR